MILTARIEPKNYQRIVDSSGSVTYTADIYVNVYDETGNLANVDYGTVTIRTFYLDAGYQDEVFTIIGSSRLYTSGIVNRTDSMGEAVDSINYSIVKDYTPIQAPVLVTDVHIDSVIVDKKESAPGAADGQVTINAFSSGGSVMYSLDNANFQTSATFGNLAGGAYTAYINNANGDEDSYAFFIDTIQNLLTGAPSVDLGGGNVSRWSAAFNPIRFTYQRKDFAVVDIFNSSVSSGTQFLINADTSAIKQNDQVYINAGAYKGVYQVDTPAN